MASWAGETRKWQSVDPSPLAALLAARERTQVDLPAGLPPVRPRGDLVRTPQALPANLPYGPTDRGLAQSQRFNGGLVQHPVSLVHGQESNFVAPNFPQSPLGTGFGGGTASPYSGGRSALAALMLGGGGSGGSSGGGGQTPILTPQLKAQVAGQSGYGTPRSTPAGSGFAPTAPTFGGGGFTPTSSAGSTAAGTSAGVRSGLSSSLASAAQRGTKLRLPV